MRDLEIRQILDFERDLEIEILDFERDLEIEILNFERDLEIRQILDFEGSGDGNHGF